MKEPQGIRWKSAVVLIEVVIGYILDDLL